MVVPRALALHRISSYGEEGYTGELDVTVEFTFTDLNELIIEYLATTNKKTIVNLTHHAFFCLAGAADPTPTIEDQICEINADFYLPTDATAIPTGEILKVEGTPFDFRKPKTFGKEALLQESLSQRAAVHSSAIPPNQVCSFTQLTSLQAIRAPTVVLSHIAQQYALRLSTSPTHQIVLTSQALY